MQPISFKRHPFARSGRARRPIVDLSREGVDRGRSFAKSSRRWLHDRLRPWSGIDRLL